MTTLILSKTFPTFNQLNRRRKSSIKRQSRRNFDQIISPVDKVPDYRTSEYFFDYLSVLTSDQSLSQDQIARSQTKTIGEKFDSVSQKYEITEAEGVKNFLSKNRPLILLLEEIPNKIYQYFGNNERLSLKISYEPDFPQSSELWVYILTELSAKEALPILEKFDEEWWLENMDRADCQLNITLKFV